ncbi:S-methyl-5'-thioadenosine phosphorylase [Candidatus Desulforudis audaxviator]|uniref:Probable 6-oxopurine nucleoside phosphorylase n=1 Tax=Desulforudis audaxviator (strain MP104C) TaxID=477974 RepID=B1I2E1_DESAP|nr:S-methyl-5'-thioadenosine phosphorylase [Candidatus Desulforudis audaxviator]ACA59181.1 methylthioadenosine phosphorylase [Candidatus Desulforudis audaxviator MP104C]AZK59251.1 5'-methylthioadenosine phosphorylase [Candidatus Desulforudis audaxviator]
MTVRIAVIGGTGVYDPAMLGEIREDHVRTPYGEVDLQVGRFEGREVAFMARHGRWHSVPPHLVNYRANIMALKQLGVRSILATAAVGSLNLDMKPGDFVFCDQFLDFTKSRAQTFFEGGPEGVVHVDMTEPYCPELRALLEEAAAALKLTVHPGGTYAATEGPRFESPAEIRMLRHLGADLAGMTGVPEVVLAREAGICYATICMVTNFAAGISPHRLTHEEVLEAMRVNAAKIRSLIAGTVLLIDPERSCPCHEAVRGPVVGSDNNVGRSSVVSGRAGSRHQNGAVPQEEQ